MIPARLKTYLDAQRTYLLSTGWIAREGGAWSHERIPGKQLTAIYAAGLQVAEDGVEAKPRVFYRGQRVTCSGEGQAVFVIVEVSPTGALLVYANSKEHLEYGHVPGDSAGWKNLEQLTPAE